MGERWWRLLVLSLLAIWVACGGGSTDGGTDPRPPPRTVSRSDVEAAASTLPKTVEGLPILQRTAMVQGGELGLVYNGRLDDALARWGQCLSQVAGCYRRNQGRIGGCVEFITPCETDAGGDACCAPGCIARFKSLVEQGRGEVDAVQESFVRGDCLQGFAEQMAPLFNEVRP